MKSEKGKKNTRIGYSKKISIFEESVAGAFGIRTVFPKLWDPVSR